jgi:hypothetical protein
MPPGTAPYPKLPVKLPAIAHIAPRLACSLQLHCQAHDRAQGVGNVISRLGEKFDLERTRLQHPEVQNHQARLSSSFGLPSPRQSEVGKDSSHQPPVSAASAGMRGSKAADRAVPVATARRS